MSEKLFACLLRLYPSRFREKYGDEAVQLYRDLYRHETGVLRRMRFWCDLLVDLVAGLPSAYRNTYVSAAGSPVAQIMPGAPSFRVLEPEPMPPGLFVMGSLLTLTLLGAFSFVVNHPVAYHEWSASSDSSSPIEAVLERLNRSESSGQPGTDTAKTDGSVPDDGRIAEARKTDSLAAHPVDAETPKAVDPNESHLVIAPVSEIPPPHFPNPQQAVKAQEALQQNQRQGVLRPLAEAKASSADRTLNRQQMRPDAKGTIANNNDSKPSRSGYSATIIGAYQAATKQQDCNLGNVEVLPDNIGYFKRNSFPDLAVCGPCAQEAMNRPNDTSSIVFDPRAECWRDPALSLPAIPGNLVLLPAVKQVNRNVGGKLPCGSGGFEDHAVCTRKIPAKDGSVSSFRK